MRERHPNQEQPAQRVELRHPPRFGIAQLHLSHLSPEPETLLNLRRIFTESASPSQNRQQNTQTKEQKLFTEINENRYIFLTAQVLKYSSAAE
jgi:hypothetical protein